MGPDHASARLILDEHHVGKALQQALSRRLGSDVEIAALKRYPVGYSWLTYGFEARWQGAQGPQQRALILRLGPPHGLFAPYRARPQFVVLQALANSGVPVPAVHWHSDEPEEFGAPFFICDRVPGRAPVMWGEHFSDAQRRALGEQFVDALALLHRFEWRGSAIETLETVPAVHDTAHREVQRWEQALRRWQRRRIPMAESVLAWLRERAPAAARVSVVHGDYRIGNFLADFTGDTASITAILDWELAHLGDPHEDIGYMCQRTFRPGTPLICTLIEREALYERYAARSGIALSPAAVHFYEVLGLFKFYAIDVAAEACFESGHNDLRLPSMAAQSARLLLQLEKLIAEAP